MARERGEEVELGAGRLHLDAAHEEPALQQVEHDVAALEAARLDRGARRALQMPDRNPDPREQLGHRERLLDVVVSSEIERLDLRLVLAPGREHDDRHVEQERAKAADRLPAVDPGQTQIEQHDVRGL